MYSRSTDVSTITTFSIATTDVASSSLQIEEMLRELGHLQASAEGGVKVSEAPKAAEDRPPSRTQVSERASVAHNVLRVPQSLGAVGPALKQRPIPESSKDAVPTMGRDKGKAAEHVVPKRGSRIEVVAQCPRVNAKIGEGNKVRKFQVGVVSSH